MSDEVSQSTTSNLWLKVAAGAVCVTAVGAGVYYFMSKNTDSDVIVPVKTETKPPRDKNTTVKESPAVASTDEEIDATPTNPEEAKALANQYKSDGNKAYKAKKPHEALKLYQKGLSVHPSPESEECAVFYCNRAACYLYMDEPAKALVECNSALKLKPKYDKALSRRAQASERLKKLPEAAHDYALFCLLTAFDKKKSQNAQQALDRILQNMASQKAAEQKKKMKPRLPSRLAIKTHFDGYCRYTAKPIIEEPKEEIEAGLKVNENDGELLLKHALILLDEGKYEESYTAAEKAVEILQEVQLSGSVKQAFIEALCLSAMYRLLRSEHEEAIEHLKQAGRLDKGNATITAMLASVYMDQGNIQEAFKNFQAALAQDDRNPDSHYQRGQAYLAQQGTQEALAAFAKAVALQPSTYAPYVQLAVVQLSGNAADRAEQTMRMCLERFPNESLVHSYYGEILHAMHRVPDAQAAFDRALELDDQNVNAVIHKATLIWQAKGNKAEAESMLQESMNIDPDYEGPYWTLAQLMSEKEDYSNALQMYDEAISRCTNEKQLIELFGLREAVKIQLDLKTEYPDLNMRAQ